MKNKLFTPKCYLISMLLFGGIITVVNSIIYIFDGFDPGIYILLVPFILGSVMVIYSFVYVWVLFNKPFRTTFKTGVYHLIILLSLSLLTLFINYLIRYIIE